MAANKITWFWFYGCVSGAKYLDNVITFFKNISFSMVTKKTIFRSREFHFLNTSGCSFV
jgi:hypothetical protein